MEIIQKGLTNKLKNGQRTLFGPFDMRLTKKKNGFNIRTTRD